MKITNREATCAKRTQVISEGTLEIGFADDGQ